MFAFGIVLMIAGAIAAAYGMFSPSGLPGRDMINLDLIHQKTLMVYVGIAGFVGGAIFTAAAGILRRLGGIEERLDSRPRS